MFFTFQKGRENKIKGRKTIQKVIQRNFLDSKEDTILLDKKIHHSGRFKHHSNIRHLKHRIQEGSGGFL